MDAKLRLWNPRTFELQLVNFGSFHQSATRAYKKVQIAVEWDSNIVYHPRGNYVIGCDIASGQRSALVRVAVCFWCFGMCRRVLLRVSRAVQHVPLAALE